MKKDFRKAAKLFTLAGLATLEALLPTPNADAADSLVYAPDGRGNYTLRTGGTQLGGEEAPIVFLNDKGNKNAVFVDAADYKASIQRNGTQETITVTSSFPMSGEEITYNTTFSHEPSSSDPKKHFKFSAARAYGTEAGSFNFYDTSHEVRKAREMAEGAYQAAETAKRQQVAKQAASQYVGDSTTQVVIEGNKTQQKTHVTTHFYNPHLAGEEGLTLSYDLNQRQVDFVGLARDTAKTLAKVQSPFRDLPFETQNNLAGILVTESLLKGRKAFVQTVPEPQDIPEPGEIGGIVIGNTTVANMDHLIGYSLEQIELATNSAIVKAFRGKESNGLFLDRAVQNMKIEKRQQEAKRERENKALETFQREAKERATLAEKIRTGKATPAERENFDRLQKKLIEANAKNPFAPHMDSSSKVTPGKSQKQLEPTGTNGATPEKSQIEPRSKKGDLLVRQGKNGKLSLLSPV